MKTSHRIAIITPQDIARFVPNRKRKGPKTAKKKTTFTPVEASEHLIEQFGSEKILAALKDAKGKPINIDWLVKRWVEEAEEAEASKDRREALLKLEEFIVLGAIQDKELAASVGKIVEAEEKTPDPFNPDSVRIVKDSVKKKRA